MSLLLLKIIRQRCLALALLGALALAGCNAVKLGYEQGPSLLYWWLDGHLDFDSTQNTKVREALERLQRWHRQNELLPAADLLARMANLAQGPIESEQACQITREAQTQLDRLMREAIRSASPVATTLGAAQIGHLTTHLERKNVRWEEQWLQGSTAARQQRRLDKLVDRYADLYGSLSTEQVNLLRQQLDPSVWSPEWGRRERLRQQRDLLNALMHIEQEHLPPKQAEAALQGVWERWLKPTAETDRQRWQTWIEQGCRNFAELHASTSPEQRQRAVRRLRAYEKDLRELAAR